jgi:hypothetical protein
MLLRISLLFLPLLAFAQQAAPKTQAEVEQELRARVTAFYQIFVDGSPRKGEAFVAEDTKDFYYNAQKLHFASFRIDKVTFTDGLNYAIVKVVGRAERRMASQSVMMDVPQDTHWKIENGQWVWTYHAEDYCLTPMCGANPPLPSGTEGPIAPPKNLSPEEMKRLQDELVRAQTLQGAMAVEPEMLKMKTDQTSSVQVTFTNPSPGYVTVALSGPMVRGLTWKWDTVQVPGRAKAVVTLHYDPSDQSGPSDAWTAKGPIEFQVVVSPNNKLLPFTVNFTK